jgi:hypothetical protein
MASYTVNEHGVDLDSAWGEASEWRHKAIELAAHDLLQHLDSAPA